MWHVSMLAAVVLLCGCSTLHYDRTQPGELKGKLTVEWVRPDKFVFRPDKDRPLTFIRHNQDVITPGLMYTDGGSIPRPLWAIRNYSPWGYAPAYIIHDWLFHVKNCQLPGHEKLTLEESAWVLSEVMKTLMEKQGRDELTLYAVFEGVNSPIASNVFNAGDCVEAPSGLIGGAPALQYVIEFP